MKQLGALTSGVAYTAPAYSTGTILPYELQAEIKRQTAQLQQSIDAAAEDIIQSNISALGSLG